MVPQTYALMKNIKYSLFSSESYGPGVCMLNMHWKTINYHNIREKVYVCKFSADYIFSNYFLCTSINGDINNTFIVLKLLNICVDYSYETCSDFSKTKIIVFELHAYDSSDIR